MAFLRELVRSGFAGRDLLAPCVRAQARRVGNEVTHLTWGGLAGAALLVFNTVFGYHFGALSYSRRSVGTRYIHRNTYIVLRI